jgi:HEAT repeat protein
MLKRLILAVTAIVLTQSCEQTKEETINKFSDPTIVKIYEYKDRRLSDSLYQYFNSPSISIKTEAILAFGSIQDTTAIDQLGKLLTREADTTARKAIAFAIGQTPSQKSERILLGAIMNEKNPEVLKELLEAYGRSTTHWQLIQPSFVEDTIKAQGLAWSIYRAGLKNKADTAANRVAGILVHQRHHHLTQMAAAHYYARSASNFEKQFSIIADIAKQDESSEVRMAAVYALRKINTP